MQASVIPTAINGVLSPVRAVNASNSWIVFISGKGDVNALNIGSDAKMPTKIRRITSRSQCEFVDLGP
ncbi:hypothetical protein FRB99_001096, partial [Tulasnella sp. 403]